MRDRIGAAPLLVRRDMAATIRDTVVGKSASVPVVVFVQADRGGIADACADPIKPEAVEIGSGNFPAKELQDRRIVGPGRRALNY
jgi:hypothetical protein